MNLDWDQYFLKIAKIVAERSSCVRRKVGAVIALEHRIISTGYNGTPRGIKNCDQGGCPRANSEHASGEGLDQGFCNHAEENAILNAAFYGIALKNSSIYTTFSPCILCAKMIIQVGIKEVFYLDQYSIDEESLSLLNFL